MILLRTLVIVVLIHAPNLYGQKDTTENTLDTQFADDVKALVDSLHIDQLTQEKFYEIYHWYGETMREAYENRTSWTGLNHVYQWAVRERDSQMSEILTRDQLYYFKKRQKEIEHEARKRKAKKKNG